MEGVRNITVGEWTLIPGAEGLPDRVRFDVNGFIRDASPLEAALMAHLEAAHGDNDVLRRYKDTVESDLRASKLARAELVHYFEANDDGDLLTVVDALAAVYGRGAGLASQAVAEVCDRELDKTGALLGKVRARAKELRHGTG